MPSFIPSSFISLQFSWLLIKRIIVPEAIHIIIIITSQIKIINNYIQKVYLWMFIGLIITSITAYFFSQNPDLYNVILGNDIVFYGLLIAQFVAAITIVAFIKRIPDNLAEITFGFYCFL